MNDIYDDALNSLLSAENFNSFYWSWWCERVLEPMNDNLVVSASKYI